MTGHRDFKTGDNDNIAGGVINRDDIRKSRVAAPKQTARTRQPAEPAASRIRNRAAGIFRKKNKSAIRDHKHLFDANTKQICDPAKGVATFRNRIDDITALLEQSRTGQFLMRGHNDATLRITYDKQTNTALYHPASRQIMINPVLPKAVQVILLARELRRAWQHAQNLIHNPMLFEPEDAVLLNRVQIADSRVIATRVAWELKLTGRDDIWTELEDSSLAPLAMAYAKQAGRDFRAANNGSAARAAFDAWFDAQLCRMHDRRLIQEMLADELGYVFGGKGPAMEITPEWLIEMGEMPFSQNYMVIPGLGLPIDNRYSAIKDRANANFLWFIKFERSFGLHAGAYEDIDEQEMELEDVRDNAVFEPVFSTAELLNEATGESAEIIDFNQFCDSGAH